MLQIILSFAAAVGALVPLVPGVNAKVEYRLTATGLAKRSLGRGTPASFQDVFRWDQLSHIVPLRHGFKYYLTVNEPRPLRRFCKVHLSDAFSGEVQLEPEDQERVRDLLEQLDVATSKPAIGS